MKTSQLMLLIEIIAVCSETHKEHINTLCGQNVEFVNVKPSGTCSDHCALRGYYFEWNTQFMERYIDFCVLTFKEMHFEV
jgi:hypothetical protein